MNNRPNGVKQENSDGSTPAAPVFVPKIVARRRPGAPAAPSVDIVNGPAVAQARVRPEREKKETHVMPVKVSLQAASRRANNRASMTTAESMAMQAAMYTLDPAMLDAAPRFPPTQLPFPVSESNQPWMDQYAGDEEVALPAYKDASLPKVIEMTKNLSLDRMEPILPFQSAKEVLLHESVMSPIKSETGELSLPPPQFAFLQLPSHLPFLLDKKSVKKPQQQQADMLKHDIPMTVDDILIHRPNEATESSAASQYRVFSSHTENNITHLPEGQIGEFIVYKSGKAKMKIGDILFDLDQGIHVPHHQQLVAMHTSEEDGPCMIPIAEVRHQLVCSVDVKYVINKKNEEEKNVGTLKTEIK